MVGRIFYVIFVASMINWSAVEAATVSDAFQQIKGSVVTIHTKQRNVLPSGKVATAEGLGSGVLFSAEGHILTAAHVVQVAFDVKVKFPNGDTFPAKVVTSEPLADVALLKIDKVPRNAVIAKLGDSDSMAVGSQVFIVGAPYGLSHTLTVGYISARHEPYSMPVATLAELFQTDAAINQGNSGGPMFNMAGEVVGIVSHILTKSGGFEGLGFAVTSNTARTMLIEDKPFWSGMNGFLLISDLAKALNVPQSRAILVQHVAERSPAERIGLKGGKIPIKIGKESLLLGGDIILSVMGISIAEDESYHKIKEAIKEMADGDELTVKVLREGTLLELSRRIK